MIKGCIFDLDGTLLDTVGTIAHYGNYALSTHGYRAAPVDSYRYFAGNGAKKLVERMLIYANAYTEDAFSRVYATYMQAYDASPLHLTRPFDGIDALLVRLRSCGVKTAVLSNKPDSAARPIVSHFFGDAFSYVTGARDGVALKPAPDGACAIMDALSLRPEETLFIGDTGVDMETGKNAGLRPVGCLWGFRDEEELRTCGAEYIVRHPNEIITLVEKENGTIEN